MRVACPVPVAVASPPPRLHHPTDPAKRMMTITRRTRRLCLLRLRPHLVLLLFLVFSAPSGYSQQLYEDNEQLKCYATNGSSTLGYSCNGQSSSCSSYLTFRAQSTLYQSPAQIASLLGADASNISRINGVNSVAAAFPANDLVLVPVTCSCAGSFYQHNSTYTLGTETYLVLANNTYQGLTTCQALMAQNPYDSRNLSAGLRLHVPLRCACPTADQQEASGGGAKYLLSYLITWKDTIEAIASIFQADFQAILQANNLTSSSVIYPFTTLLIPLKTELTKDDLVFAAPPPPSPPPPPPVVGSSSSSGNGSKWVFVGIGVGVGLVALLGGVVLIWWFRRRKRPQGHFSAVANNSTFISSVDAPAEHSELSSKGFEPPSSVYSIARMAVESLTVYEFHELERATGGFSEDHRIQGSVYRGAIYGDDAAIKRLKGDVSSEINILKQINHSNVIRLSGFCFHEGNTYLVYEFAEKGSLGDWLHHRDTKKDADKDKGDDASAESVPCLSWKQRVGVCYDVADALNYLHNYSTPPYVHQNLKSSNVLLDGEFRAKIANFGLARAVADDGSEGAQLTRHVVGTHGYMAPEYLEHGLVTPKLDVFAFGVIMLELLSGKEATFTKEGEEKKELLLSASIGPVMSGEDVRSKLKAFVDPCLRSDYPFELAFAMAELAMRCLDSDPGARPSMAEVLLSLSAIHSSSLDWDPSELSSSRSLVNEN